VRGFCFKSAVVVLCFFFCPVENVFSGFAQGVNLYLDASDEEWGLIESIFYPSKRSPVSYPSFIHAKRILVLGDGFSIKWNSNAEVFQSYLQSYLGSLPEIYKTDLECPPDLDGSSQRNLHYKRVDHRQVFPFEDGMFDVISMSYGLCLCQCSQNFQKEQSLITPGLKSGVREMTSCGGIDFNTGSFFFFLSEVARVLNSRQPHAVAFLHGPQDTVGEQKVVPIAVQLIPALEQYYSQLSFRLVFLKSSKGPVFQGVYIRVRKF